MGSSFIHLIRQFKWILFNGWVIFHGVYVPQLPYPFVCWWPFLQPESLLNSYDHFIYCLWRLILKLSGWNEFFLPRLFSFFFLFLNFFYFLYCSGFCHTLKWNNHGFTCVPDPPSHLPLHRIPLGLPSAPGPSTCLMHPTWAGDLFHRR